MDSVTDLTERLRAWGADRRKVDEAIGYGQHPNTVLLDEAATTLETLTQEVERLRGLLIDPGDPAWEDARAVLVAELRKAGFNGAAKQIGEGEGCNIPSWIALNLIAHSRKSLTQENARLREAGWRDIESAPQDGTEMDLWCDIEGYRPGRVTNCVWMHGPSGPDWYTRGERGWEPIGAIGVKPTHWMPLPPAPARKALGGGDE